MALSYSSCFGTHHCLNQEMVAAHQAEVDFAKELLCFCDNCGNPRTLLDDFYHHQHPPISHEINLCSFLPNSLLWPDTFPSDEFDHFRRPKYARTFMDPHLCSPLTFDGPAFYHPPPPPPPLEAEFVFSTTQVKRSEEECCSAQSLAARQRRKKISEKTQELGKLIPGGNKMNTAERFHAAFKYVKFMQAQLAILQYMASIKFQRGGDDEGVLHGLLSCTKIQERLYEEEKCIVPVQVVEALAEDEEICTNPSISKALHSLLYSCRQGT